MMSPAAETSCVSDRLSFQWKVEEWDGICFCCVYTHCVRLCVVDTSALCMGVRQQIWAYGWSQSRFNQSLVVSLIPSSDSKHQHWKRVKEGDRRKYKKKKIIKTNRRTLKFIRWWCHPWEVTFRGQRRKRWPHQKRTRVDAEKGLSVIWGAVSGSALTPLTEPLWSLYLHDWW